MGAMRSPAVAIGASLPFLTYALDESAAPVATGLAVPPAVVVGILSEPPVKPSTVITPGFAPRFTVT